MGPGVWGFSGFWLWGLDVLQHVGLNFWPGLNLCPTSGECGFLTTGQPGSPLGNLFSKLPKSPLLISVIIFGGPYSYVAVSLINLDLLEHRHYLFHHCYMDATLNTWQAVGRDNIFAKTILWSINKMASKRTQLSYRGRGYIEGRKVNQHYQNAMIWEKSVPQKSLSL